MDASGTAADSTALTLNGQDGNDVLIGGPGADVLDGKTVLTLGERTVTLPQAQISRL